MARGLSLLWRIYRALVFGLFLYVALSFFVLCTWGMGAAPLMALAHFVGAVLLGFGSVALLFAITMVVAIVRWALLFSWRGIGRATG